MSRSKRQLTPEERELWRKVALTVKTRPHLPDAPPLGIATDPLPRAPPKLADRPLTPTRPTTKPPADRSAEKRVRRGRLEIGGSLDLHGHTQDSAQAALQRFLAVAHARGDRVVIVITGVGRGGEGVLRRRLPDWLADKSLRGFVSGFAPAHRTHGGTGAFYVFLRREPRA